MSKVEIQINGSKIVADEGESILNVALDAGIYVPHLCYHKNLLPIGACGLCTVDVDGVFVRACETLVSDNMNVITSSEEIEKVRFTALELMLASHPKDCTSCNKYLNCELQALLQYTGVAHARLREIEKQNTNVLKSDSLIQREMYRCVQCERCVRVCKDVRGVSALCVNKKNGESYISTNDDLPLEDTTCRACGACVEVCPTGAIQDTIGVFKENVPKQQAYIPCQYDCPAHTDIPMYLRLTKEGNYSDAVCVIREKLTFPHSLGYICTHACESGCKRTKINEAIAIRELKKFAVENDKTNTWKNKVVLKESNDKKIAIIGSGVSGMSAGFHLAIKGYKVDVYEKQEKAGGMLSYGIPKYRLSQQIVDDEIKELCDFGINLITNSEIKNIFELTEKNYDAVLVSVGAGAGKRPPIYNTEFENGIDAVKFCENFNKQMYKNDKNNIVVYGGGNVAFDCAINAKKLGTENVQIICMESREEMLADKEEIALALELGIVINNNCVIHNINQKENYINSIDIVNISSFEFTANGLEVTEIVDSVRNIEIDTLVFATGQKTELSEDFGIELVNGTFAKINENMETSVGGVFASGDVVYGTKSVVMAIQSGVEVASKIDLYLGGDGNTEVNLYERKKNDGNIGVIENFYNIERKSCFNNSEEAEVEANRCLQCDLRLDIEKTKYWVDSKYKQDKGGSHE